MSVVDNIIHLFAPLTANCSEFKEGWQAAAVRQSSGVGGCWQGEWVSAATGHRGPLRCVVDPIAPHQWRMAFRAEYGKIFRACYSTEFTVHQGQEAERWTFSGGSDLGILAGGAYEYQGWATLQELICSYKSSKDHGEFRLRKIRT
jgi:hypothetical protein